MTAPVMDALEQDEDLFANTRHSCCPACNGLPARLPIPNGTPVVMLCGIRKPFRRRLQATGDPICPVCADLLQVGFETQRCPNCGRAA